MDSRGAAGHGRVWSGLAVKASQVQSWLGVARSVLAVMDSRGKARFGEYGLVGCGGRVMLWQGESCLGRRSSQVKSSRGGARQGLSWRSSQGESGQGEVRSVLAVMSGRVESGQGGAGAVKETERKHLSRK